MDFCVGYGFDFHAGSAGYSQWGSAAAAAAGRTGEQYYRPEQYHQVEPIGFLL